MTGSRPSAGIEWFCYVQHGDALRRGHAAPLGGDIRLFDVTFDPAVTRRKSERPATVPDRERFAYDPFGLVVTRKDVFATGARFRHPSITHDPVTLNVTSTTDTNGTVRGTTYDGFGRQTRSKVTPPGGTGGVLSSTTYRGFELSTQGCQGNRGGPLDRAEGVPGRSAGGTRPRPAASRRPSSTATAASSQPRPISAPITRTRSLSPRLTMLWAGSTSRPIPMKTMAPDRPLRHHL